MSTATKTPDLRERLRSIEADLSRARTERTAVERAHKDNLAALDRVEASNADFARSPEYRATEKSHDELRTAREQVDQLQQTQIGTLQMLGRDGHRGGRDGNGPTSDYSGGDGWRSAAQAIDMEHGRDRVHLRLGTLLPRAPLAAAGVTVSPSSELPNPTLEQPTMQAAMDTRALFPVFAVQQLEPEDASITDFRLTKREVEGESVERDPIDATTEKAKLGAHASINKGPVGVV